MSDRKGSSGPGDLAACLETIIVNPKALAATAKEGGATTTKKGGATSVRSNDDNLLGSGSQPTAATRSPMTTEVGGEGSRHGVLGFWGVRVLAG